MSQKNILIIGAGPSGLTAGRLLADAGCQVRIMEKRSHTAGNCFDEYDEHGVLVHRYGPHYFRTDSRELLRWLSQFTDWIPGRYYVRAAVGEKLVPLPISLSTMTALKERVFDRTDFENYLAENRASIEAPANAEEQCLALVGEELYELIFRNYTTKQWGIPPKELDASVTARIPLRFDWNERYVNEAFQVMPRAGFTRMFENMGDHPNIRIETESDVETEWLFSERENYDAVIYTGPIDRLFSYRFGELGYRSLRFEYVHHDDAEFVQPCVQINYPNDHEYTRTVEIKHVTGQKLPGTTVCYEYPRDTGEPFYPLLTPENQDRYAQYQQLVETECAGPHPIYLVGRLAEFKYFNTDQVILRSMDLANTIIRNWRDA